MMQRIALVTMFLSLLFSAGAARTASAAQPLPSVAAIHARFVDALGGRRAVLRPRSVTTRGYYPSPAHGTFAKISFVRYAADFKQLEIDTGGKHGPARFGFNSGIGWGVNPYPKARPQLADGAYLQSVRRDADLYYWGHISSYLRTETVVGVEQFGGHRCYHVRGATKWGNENNQFFDTTTGLLAGYAFQQWNPTNTGRERTLTRQFIDAYRNVGGLLIPMRATTYHNGRFIVREQDTSVGLNSVDARVFALPPSVVAALGPPRSRRARAG
jgi:hypothetical protein